jgi:hypothetical protein
MDRSDNEDGRKKAPRVCVRNSSTQQTAGCCHLPFLYLYERRRRLPASSAYLSKQVFIRQVFTTIEEYSEDGHGYYYVFQSKE